ncbi:uncharacterized protein LOC129001582 [Macrosteles quadrilineatus]|uniref:uncharacterized protein LOC129001482 n=1 Tax=Macrosteles quadrilineatus TaxID=74068 RepID=UPI0023E2C9CE|nr:uncharacterized protein LOC129001482 [Macrosteles quadrilineatus]XP_054284902.1 uncharacterized protein LOC129001582 [Macrosteles quadrilineatus]
MVLVRNCFCCFSLRSGMLLLGWTQAVMSILALIGVILDDSSISSSDIHRFFGTSIKTLYVLLGGSVIQTIAAVFLLYGVYMKKSSYVLEYVKLETLLHFATLLEFLLYLLLEYSTFSTHEVYIFLAFLGINYGLAVYYLIAAYSYYQIMTNPELSPLNPA